MSQCVLTALLVLHACVLRLCVCGLGIDKLHPERRRSIWQTPGVECGAVVPLTQPDHFFADRESKMYRLSRICTLTFQSSLLKRLEEFFYMLAFQSSEGCRPSYFCARDMHTLNPLIISVAVCTVLSQCKDFCTSDACSSFLKL